MNKTEFISRLQHFATHQGVGLPDEYGHPDYRSSRGEPLLADMLARWLSNPEIPEGDGLENWIRDLPNYVVEAYAEFSAGPAWKADRTQYREQTDHDLPDLVDAHAGGLIRMLVAHNVCRLLPLLARQPWLAMHLESSLGAQAQVIDHAWRRFVRVAYRQLMPRIRAESHRGNIGTFGETRLLTYAIAGRIVFSFQRGTARIDYIADDGDAYGNRSGANTPGAPYAECVAMIEDVIAHWDSDKLEPSDAVRIAGWD